MTEWYAKGEMGEYILDLVESTADGSMTVAQLAQKLDDVGLITEEIDDVIESNGFSNSVVADLDSYYGI